MLALAFLNPALLWALPLAAVPVIIHLLNRRRFRTVPWAAMEFLLAAMKRNRKRLRMEQWLVLLLRVLAVLLLVSLVSRPQLGGGSLLGTRTHHVVLLDDSASMTQRTANRTAVLFQRAQDRVKTLAEDLARHRAGDLFSLVRTSRPGAPEVWGQRIGPESGTGIGARLKELSVGDDAPDLGEALSRVQQRAAAEPGGRIEYYVVSDQRAQDWATDDDKARPRLAAALAAMQPDREHVTVLACAGEQPNVAIVDVRLMDRIAVAGVAVGLAVDVQNLGLDPTPAGNLTVEVDGQSRVLRPVPPLAPGEKVAVPLAHTFHQAGFHRLDASLDASEAYPIDDRRTLALEVRDRSRVLLVDGQPDEDEGECFYLQAALDPGGEAVSGIEAQLVSEAAFAETDLEPFDLVWLANVPAPPAAVVTRLEQFVAKGGGLVISVGALVDGGRWNELCWKDGKGLLPLPFGEVGGDPERPEKAVLVRKDHPVCGTLGDLLELLVGNVTLVKRWLTLVDDGKQPATVVARIRDSEGPPLLVTRTFGSGGGEVAMWSVTADRFWANLPSTDLLLVFANQLHRFAARRRDTSGSNLLANGLYRSQLDPGLHRADVTVRSLSGAGEELTFTAVETPAPTPPIPPPPEAKPAPEVVPLTLQVPMAELHQLGAYEVETQRHDGGVEKRMFARNVPIAESRLLGFGEPAFRRLYPPDVQERVRFVGDQGGLGDAAGAGEVWHMLAAALLVGLLLESLLAWRFGRR